MTNPIGINWILAYRELPPQCIYDQNGNGEIEIGDLAAFLAHFGTCTGDPAFDPNLDFDADGCSGISDLAELLSQFGLPCCES